MEHRSAWTATHDRHCAASSVLAHLYQSFGNSASAPGVTDGLGKRGSHVQNISRRHRSRHRHRSRDDADRAGSSRLQSRARVHCNRLGRPLRLRMSLDTPHDVVCSKLQRHHRRERCRPSGRPFRVALVCVQCRAHGPRGQGNWAHRHGVAGADLDVLPGSVPCARQHVRRVRHRPRPFHTRPEMIG
jgi:hypothetical protein